MRHLCLGRGARAGDGGARRHRQDLHPRRGARGLRALGRPGRSASPGRARPPTSCSARPASPPRRPPCCCAGSSGARRTPSPTRSVIVVDEASVMPTRALERLAHEAAWRSARLVLVGDRAQLPSIDAGGGFAALADRLGAVELTENRRQADRAAARGSPRTWPRGGPPTRWRCCQRAGASQSFDDAREARVALVSAWAQAELESPGRNLMLAHDRHDVAELNRLAREWREQWGFISDRRIVGRRSRVGDRRSAGVPAQRLRPRGAQRHPRDGRRRSTATASTSTCAPTTARSCACRPTTWPTPATATPSPATSRQGESVDRTFVLASPERGGAEWAYVAGSRQRHDLQVFVTHHEAGGRRGGPRPGLVALAGQVARARPGGSGRARARRSMRCAATSTRATPERLLARAEELRARARRSRARRAAAVPTASWRASPSCGRRCERAERGLRGGRGATRRASASASIASRRGGGASGAEAAGRISRGRARTSSATGPTGGRRASRAGASRAGGRRRRARARAAAQRGAVRDRAPARRVGQRRPAERQPERTSPES